MKKRIDEKEAGRKRKKGGHWRMLRWISREGKKERQYEQEKTTRKKKTREKKKRMSKKETKKRKKEKGEVATKQKM